MSIRKQLAILTLHNDIHGVIIQKELEKYDNIMCHVIETDRICGAGNITWSNTDDKEFECVISTRDGETINVKELGLVWWRRVNYPQKIPGEVADDIHIDLINNECRESLWGIFLKEFNGVWINDPTSTRMAENKLVQLRNAHDAGFRVPRTLVSQNVRKIKKFCSLLDNNVVVKPVRGTQQYHLFTRMLTEEHLSDDTSLHLCPTMYQEYIEGYKHIRAHCFGDEVYAAMIESHDLDWRENLDIPFSVYELDDDTKLRLRKVMRSLGLKMGVIDLKISNIDKTPVWLEVNPQGQFLFVEGLSGIDLASKFSAFLQDELTKSRYVTT
jgi:glutathione synthase/RimK-type ligase-like ATP-grasp enzyme